MAAILIFPDDISLKFVPKGPINNIPALVQIMAWCRPGDMPLSEAMIVRLQTHICVIRPQWVKMKFLMIFMHLPGDNELISTASLWLQWGNNELWHISDSVSCHRMVLKGLWWVSWWISYHRERHIDLDGLVQERCNSSALAMELRLSCIDPSIWCWTECNRWHAVAGTKWRVTWEFA